MPDQTESFTGLRAEDVEQLEQSAPIRERLVDAAKFAVAGVVGYVTCKYAGEAFDASFVPEVPVYPQITQGITLASDSLRAIAPGVMAGAASVGVYTRLRGRHDDKIAAHITASKSEYSAAQNHNSGGRMRRGLRTATAGTALAATVLVSAAAGIEHEVKDGPTRAIDKAISLLSPTNDSPQFIVQDRTQQFMNNSHVPREQADEFIAEAERVGVTAAPFYRELGDVIDESGRNVTNLTLGVPDQIFDRILISGGIDPSTVSSNGSCENVPVIIDDDGQVSSGDHVTVQAQSSEVVYTISGASSMNRIAVIERADDLARCIQHNEDSNYYGIVLSAGSDVTIQNLFENSRVHDSSHLVSAEQFKEYNEKFWGANGTPILLQLMGYIAAFGFIANRNERRAILQNDIKELGALDAGGVTKSDFQKIESLRALQQSMIAAAISVPLAPALAAGVNAAEWGLKVGIGAREIAVGFTLTLGAKLFGARRAISKFSKKMTAAEAMKG